MTVQKCGNMSDCEVLIDKGSYIPIKPNSKSFIIKLGNAISLILSPYLLLVVSLLYTIQLSWLPVWLLHVITITTVVGILYFKQDFLLYHPCSTEQFCYYVPKPVPANGYPAEQVYLQTADGAVAHGYFLKQSGAQARNIPTVLLVHGNAGSVGFPIYLALFDIQLVNVLAIDYHGYGKSTGKPSEEALYADANAGLEYLLQRDDINHSKIIVYGHSLGGAVAINLATQQYKEHIAGLIVENSFTNIREAAQCMLKCCSRLLQFLPDVCYRNKFDSLSKVGHVTCPALFMCGRADKILHYKMTHTLMLKCQPARTRLKSFNDFGHNDLFCTNVCQRTIAKFLKEFFECQSRFDDSENELFMQ